ncbi:MAG: hypothetical protein M3281_04570 [Chloroflexota bacterium]|nr:hypothetical protein [Chloroflexota bacterium]
MRDIRVWQRGYFEHVIRNDRELEVLREYIATNPARWYEDSLYAAEPQGYQRITQRQW